MSTWRKVGCCLVTVAGLAFGASAAPQWTVGPNDCGVWKPDLRNVFLDATISGNLTGLANRTVGAGEAEIRDNAIVTFTLAKPASISAINFYSHHTDGGCDGICVLSIEVNQDGQWITLENSAVEYGTKRIDGNNNGKGTTNGSLKGLFSCADDGELASNVSAVRINFGLQDNGVTRYGEIEAIGTYVDGTRHLKVAALEEEFGTITISPASADGWFPEGSDVTVAFAPSQGVSFLKWSGDVTDEQKTVPEISLRMDGSRSIKGYAYSSLWIYKNGKLTDGLRTFNASGANDAITITGTSDLGGTNIVDLSLPIYGDGKIVGISAMSGVATLYLPPTLKTIANRAFVTRTELKTVIPFLPDSVTTLGGGCFADARNLSGSLRLGYATDADGNTVQTVIGIHDGVRSIAFQGPALGPVVDLGPGVTDILPYFANNCGNVTNLYFGGALTRIAASAFAGLGGSKKVDVTFAEDAPATFAQTAFGTPASQKLRIFIPWTGEEAFPRWGAFATDETLVTPWKKLDPTVRQAYRTAFPSAQYGAKSPYGLTTSSSPLNTDLPIPADQWIMATIAAEAGDWVAEPYDAANWQASSSNLLVNATAAEGTPVALANGVLDAAAPDGNVTDGQVCTWTLPGRAVLYGFNFYTRAEDGHRDGISVERIEVQTYGSDDWVEIDVPPVEFGTANVDGGDVAHGGVVGTYRASYFRNNRSELASDVVAVRVTFGTPQDNGASSYAEVEAIGAASGWTLRVPAFDAAFGAVTFDPPSETGAYPAGTTVTVTVTPQPDVEFVEWTGDVDEAHRTDNPLVVTLTADCTVTPKLLANFLLYKSGHLMDGVQDYKAIGEMNAITVTGKYKYGDGGLLDLNKPIYGGGKIVAIGDSAFEGNRPTTVRLPDTLETLGNRCFCQCGFFTIETGLDFPSLVNCGGASFIQDYLGKSVKVGFAKDAEGNYRPFTFALHSGDTRSIAFESCSVGPDIILGPGVTVIPPATFNGSGNVTNLWLGPNVSAIKDNAFAGIGNKAATITFEGDLPETVTASAFGTPSAHKVRIRPLVTARGGQWRWRQLLQDADKVTSWAALTSEQRAAYWQNFPKSTYGRRHPAGLTTSSAALGSATLPANVWLFDESRSGTVLFLR